MANKNAYEIRTEVLKEALGNCWNRYYQKVEAARCAAVAVAIEKTGDCDSAGDYISNIQTPSSADIVKEAEELYSFINQ